MIIDMVSSVFMQAVSSRKSNPLEAAIRDTIHQRNQNNANRHKAKSDITVLEKTLKKLKRKTGGKDILSIAVQAQINIINDTIKKSEHIDRVCADMLIELENYTFEADPEQFHISQSFDVDAFTKLMSGMKDWTRP